jgi:hypothetical protein
MTAIAAAPAAKSEPRPRYGVAITAPAVETASGALVDGEGLVTTAVEEGAVVVPGADAVEVSMPDEGAGLEGGTAPPEDGTTWGTPTGGTPVCAGGAGGTTVVASDGGPPGGTDAVDSTGMTGGAGGTTAVVSEGGPPGGTDAVDSTEMTGGAEEGGGAS